MPLEPPGDLLFIVNPGARYVHVEGPAPILTLTTPAKQAEVVVPLLVKAFNGGLGDAFNLAPWSWSTTSAELARAVGARLRQAGVREEAAQVGTGGADEEKVASEEWDRFMGQLKSLHLK